MSNTGTSSYPGTLDDWVLIGTADFKDGTATPHRGIHNQVMQFGTATQALLGTSSGTSVLKNFTAGKFAARTDGETLTNVSVTSGTASGVLVGTSQITGGSISNATIGTPDISGGTVASSTLNNVTIGTPDISGGTVAGASITTASLSSGTISGVLIGTSQITGGTANAITLGTPVLNLGSDANYDLYYRGTAGNLNRLASGTADTGKFLKSGGTAGVPVWDTPSGAGDMSTVTYDPGSVAEQLVGLTATQTLSGKTIGTAQITGGSATGMVMTANSMTSGTISGVLLGTSQITGGSVSSAVIGTPTITGGNANAVTLGTPVINVGSDANYDIYYRSAAGAFTRLSSGTAETGKFLKSGGTAAAPTWDTPAGAGDMGTVTYDPAGIAEQLVGLTGTQTLSNKTIGTAQITGGSATGMVMTANSMTSGTVSGILLGTSQVTGGTVAGASITTASLTSGTISGVLVGTSQITGGTASSITLGTPIMNVWTTSGTTVPSIPARALAPTVGTLSDSAGGTITPNAPSAQVFELTLGTTAGNRTLAVPTNPTDGQAISYRIKQNTNNTGTMVFGAGYAINNGGTPTLGTASTWNYVGFRYYAGGTAWHHQGNSLGIV